MGSFWKVEESGLREVRRKRIWVRSLEPTLKKKKKRPALGRQALGSLGLHSFLFDTRGRTAAWAGTCIRACTQTHGKSKELEQPFGTTCVVSVAEYSAGKQLMSHLKGSWHNWPLAVNGAPTARSPSGIPESPGAESVLHLRGWLLVPTSVLQG